MSAVAEGVAVRPPESHPPEGAGITVVAGLADALVVVTGQPRPGDVDDLSEAVGALQADRFGVILELSGLTVCHLDLLGVLVRARRQAAVRGLLFRVEMAGSTARPEVRRVLSLAGLVASRSEPG